MQEVMVDLRKYDLADRLKVDMISVESLLSELEDALNEVDYLKELLEEATMSKEESTERAYYQSIDNYIDEHRMGLI